MDALHTVAAHARYLHRRSAWGLFAVKENRAVFAALDALDRSDANPVVRTARTEERNRGRHKVREVRVQSVTVSRIGPGGVACRDQRATCGLDRSCPGRWPGRMTRPPDCGGCRGYEVIAAFDRLT
jgi:hypothetical protein